MKRKYSHGIKALKRIIEKGKQYKIWTQRELRNAINTNITRINKKYKIKTAGELSFLLRIIKDYKRFTHYGDHGTRYIFVKVIK